MWQRLAIGTVSAFVFKYGRGFFTRLWWLGRQLWHEVMGSLFLVLSFIFGSTTLREYMHQGLGARSLMLAFFSVLMCYFGVTSFRSARKVRDAGVARH